MRLSRLLPLLSMLLALTARAAEETAVLHPLEVAQGPALTEPKEALQKRFLAVAREKSGVVLSLRKEVEAALEQVGARDFARSDDALAKLAVAAKTQHALYVSFRVTPKGELELSGRMVKASGEREHAASVTVPRGGGSLLDALGAAAAVFFDELKKSTGAPAVAEVPVEVEPKPEVKPEPKVEPSPPARASPVEARQAPGGSPLRTVGFIVAGVGAAAAFAGAVVFATAGTVQRDEQGNIAAADAPKVAGIQAQQRAGVGVLVAGGAVAVAGAVIALVAPATPVTAVVAPRTDGLSIVVEGRF